MPDFTQPGGAKRREWRRLAALGVGVLACGLSAAQAQTADPIRVIKGPYLQDLRADGVTVMWEANAPAGGVLFVATETAALADPDALMRLSAWPRTGLWRVAAADNRRIQELRVTGLQPDTRYYYRVVLGGGASDTASFRTALTGLAPGGSFQFGLYGDSRGDGGRLAAFHRHAEVIARMRAVHPDLRFVVHTGDIVLRGSEYERWDHEFFRPAAPLMRETVLFPALGNHEQDHEHYFQFFALPGDGGQERWYRMTFAHATFLFLDSQSPCTPGSPQYEWLRRALESHDRTWLFVVKHKPALSSGGHGNNRDALEHVAPLCEQYGVDALFAGHDHNFEWSVKDGVVHVTAGGGGAAVLPIPIKREQNPWSREYIGRLHYCAVTLDRPVDSGGRVAERLRLDVIGLDGQRLTGFSITRTADGVRTIAAEPNPPAAPDESPPAAPGSGTGEEF